LLYFTHLPRSPQSLNLYQIWYMGYFCGHTVQNFLLIGSGVMILWGGEFAYSIEGRR